jgi:Lon protease-like protein
VSAVVLPIFPLPDLTFFPNTMLPLHVFEARYRAMVVDTMARDRRLAVVRLKPGYEPAYAGTPAVYDVAGAGEIVKCERLPTGRFNLVLKGDMRIRIERELPTDTLYRMVRADQLQEQPATRDLSGEIARIRNACHRLLAALGRPQGLLDEALTPEHEPGVIADQIAAVLPDADARQELLESLGVETRVTRLLAALEALVRQISGGKKED